MADRTAAARRGPAGVLTAAGSEPNTAGDDGWEVQSSLGEVSFLRMSYSVLPLVWAGAGAAVTEQKFTKHGQCVRGQPAVVVVP
jgi:hypothetical protein